MSQCEVKQILDFVSVARSSLCVYVLLMFVFYYLFLCTLYAILLMNNNDTINMFVSRMVTAR